jgi:hypothetical protein
LVFAQGFLLAIAAVPRGGAQVAPAPRPLQISVVRGEGDVHPASERTGTTIEIAVYDEKQRPVPDAVVTLSAPSVGASVFFPGVVEPTTILSPTGSDGVARLQGVRGNRVPGTFEIRVSASFEGRKGSAEITQENLKAPLVTAKRLGITGGIAAGILITVLALRSPAPPTATISTITPSRPVGPP